MTKVLVTGAAGFIGVNLCLRLREMGWSVTCVDDLSTGRRTHLDDVAAAGCDVHVRDYADAHTLGDVRVGSYDVVFHVGAVPRVAYSVERPAETDHNNVYKTLRLLEACRGNVGRFVFSSSSSVLGGAEVTYPSHENYERTPLSPYAVQKSTMEDYCRVFSGLYDLDTVCLRYFNVYGPGQYGDSPYSTVISAWCQAVYDGRPLRLDGTGEQSRDFCYVDNVVSANVLAATAGGKFDGMPINVAHGEEHTVNEVLDMFRTKFGDLHVVQSDWRKGDVMRTFADVTRARELLCYEPDVMFRDGLERTWKWWGF